MDEFDVCMDQEMRKLVVELILNASVDSHEAQFIFITPRDIVYAIISMCFASRSLYSDLEVSDKVKLLRLKDPERADQNDEDDDMYCY